MIRFIPVVEIIRLEESSEGTFGVLRIDKQVFCVTLEQDDELNKKNESSIPAQQYICVKYESPTYGLTFKILDVPDRDDCLFHPGNIIKNTEGCVLLGEHFGKLKGDRAILNSGNTFRKFMEVFEKENKFLLTVKEEY